MEVLSACMVIEGREEAPNRLVELHISVVAPRDAYFVHKNTARAQHEDSVVTNLVSICVVIFDLRQCEVLGMFKSAASNSDFRWGEKSQSFCSTSGSFADV